MMRLLVVDWRTTEYRHCIAQLHSVSKKGATFIFAINDVVNALHKTLNSGWYVSSWHGDVNLRVISVSVSSETMTGDDIEQLPRSTE